MKAIGYTQAGPIAAADSLVEFEAETPELRPHDLLVDDGTLISTVSNNLGKLSVDTLKKAIP